MLRELGVTEPNEIDLEAIAWTQGVHVRYRPLKGCEARVLGANDRAVVAINSSSRPQRRRFSLAHELGHWHHHRGKTLFCRVDDIGGNRGATQVERVANGFAADLLMPGYLFDPRADPKLPSFATVDWLADEFTVSRTAAAIRYVQRSNRPLVLAKYEQGGRGPFVCSPAVPSKWWTKKEVHPDTRAFAILYGRQGSEKAMSKAKASTWFEGWEAERHDVTCQVVASYGGGILALIHLPDSMLRD